MNRKYKLTLISLVLLFLGFASSAFAASCGRVDSNGDYWYQCDGTKITQTATGMWGDRIDNFTTTATTASWSFYDGQSGVSTPWSRKFPACPSSSCLPVTGGGYSCYGYLSGSGCSGCPCGSGPDRSGETKNTDCYVGGMCDYLWDAGDDSCSYSGSSKPWDMYKRNTSTIYSVPGCFSCSLIPSEVNLTISSNTQNYDLFIAAGSPICPVNVNLTINSGVVVSSATTSKAAIWGSQNLPTGSTVKITNNSKIYGAGGAGGIFNGEGFIPKGGDGGKAISLVSNTIIYNQNGYIFGGGGGGGCFVHYYPWATDNSISGGVVRV